MPQQEWSADFSYAYFECILTVASENFDIHPIVQAPDLEFDEGRPKLLLRHDIDLCPVRAVPMAKIEANRQIAATYYFMMNSPFYRPSQPTSLKAINTIADLGHEIGLHFDIATQSKSDLSPKDWDAKIAESAKLFEAEIGHPVRSVSFHRPLPQYTCGPDRIAGLINAYSKSWMSWYMSDSRGRWREGEPLPKLRNSHKSPLQLLIHPVWWGRQHREAPDQLQAFYEEKATHLDFKQLNDFEAALAANIGVKRRGLQE